MSWVNSLTTINNISPFSLLVKTKTLTIFYCFYVFNVLILWFQLSHPAYDNFLLSIRKSLLGFTVNYVNT